MRILGMMVAASILAMGQASTAQSIEDRCPSPPVETCTLGFFLHMNSVDQLRCIRNMEAYFAATDEQYMCVVALRSELLSAIDDFVFRSATETFELGAFSSCSLAARSREEFERCRVPDFMKD